MTFFFFLFSFFIQSLTKPINPLDNFLYTNPHISLYQSYYIHSVTKPKPLVNNFHQLSHLSSSSPYTTHWPMHLVFSLLLISNIPLRLSICKSLIQNLFLISIEWNRQTVTHATPLLTQVKNPYHSWSTWSFLQYFTILLYMSLIPLTNIPST